MSDEIFKSKKFVGVYHKILATKDKSFYITFKDENNKTIKQKIGRLSQGITEAFCFQKRVEMINKIKLGENPLKQKLRKTLLETLTQYFEVKALKERTQKWYKSSCLLFLEQTKKNYLDEFKKQDIINFKNYLEKNNKAPKTINLYLQAINSIFNFSVNENLLKNNPFKIEFLKTNNARDRFLNKSEIDLLKSKINNDTELLLFVELSLSTGARLNSILNIIKKDVSLENKTIILQNLKTNNTYTGYISQTLLQPLTSKVAELENPNSKLINLSILQVQRRIKPILDELFNQNLDLKDAKNRVVIHTFRHTFASNLAINGVPIFTIMKLLDHKDIKQTMRYSKLSKENGLNAVLELWKK